MKENNRQQIRSVLFIETDLLFCLLCFYCLSALLAQSPWVFPIAFYNQFIPLVGLCVDVQWLHITDATPPPTTPLIGDPESSSWRTETKTKKRVKKKKRRRRKLKKKKRRRKRRRRKLKKKKKKKRRRRRKRRRRKLKKKKKKNNNNSNNNNNSSSSNWPKIWEKNWKEAEHQGKTLCNDRKCKTVNWTAEYAAWSPCRGGGEGRRGWGRGGGNWSVLSPASAAVI